jgi:3-deoxy-D-manno-octulosonic-acid transferase
VESFLESEQMLIDIIKTHALAAAQAGNWSAVAATLNAQTVEVRNDKSWTMADLITLLGAESAAVIGGTIQATGASNPIFAGAWLALNITGLQLHTNERQAMITGLADAAGWPAGLKTAALAAGLTHTSLAGSVVTAAECQSAWAIDSLNSEWVTWLNETINPLLSAGDSAGLNAAIEAKVF